MTTHSQSTATVANHKQWPTSSAVAREGGPLVRLLDEPCTPKYVITFTGWANAIENIVKAIVKEVHLRVEDVGCRVVDSDALESSVDTHLALLHCHIRRQS